MTQYSKHLSYEISDDGYDIFLDGVKVITQHDPYGKIFNANLSYEENCLLHLRDMSVPEYSLEYSYIMYLAMELDVDIPEPAGDEPDDTPLRNMAYIEYISMMTDVELPN